MTSQSHSWLVQGWPANVYEKESTRGTEPFAQISRPDARCHHRSDPATDGWNHDPATRSAAAGAAMRRIVWRVREFVIAAESPPSDHCSGAPSVPAI
jgi:hypothetical protein